MGSDQTLAEWLRETEDQLYGVTRGHEAADYLEKLEADLEVATMKRVRDTDRIEKLEAALRKISDVGDEAMPSINLAKEAADLWVCLAMCVDVARKALDDAP